MLLNSWLDGSTIFWTTFSLIFASITATMSSYVTPVQLATSTLAVPCFSVEVLVTAGLDHGLTYFLYCSVTNIEVEINRRLPWAFKVTKRKCQAEPTSENSPKSTVQKLYELLTFVHSFISRITTFNKHNTLFVSHATSLYHRIYLFLLV